MQGQPQDATKSPHFCSSSPPTELCSNDTAGLPFPSAESYLMRPEILALIAGSSKEPKPPTTLPSQMKSQHLPLLHQESQKRGLVPRFDIEGDQCTGFGGIVKIGGEKITREEREQTKKAAKKVLAEKALEGFKAMSPLKRKLPAAETHKGWIGMLHGAQSFPFVPNSLLPASTFTLLMRSFVNRSPQIHTVHHRRASISRV